jgi:DNA repair photolyase
MRSEQGPSMPSFEDFGRKLDREIERLRELAEKKIGPATRRKTAQSLRRMSEKLAQMAADIEAKVEPKADSR